MEDSSRTLHHTNQLLLDRFSDDPLSENWLLRKAELHESKLIRSTQSF